MPPTLILCTAILPLSPRYRNQSLEVCLLLGPKRPQKAGEVIHKLPRALHCDRMWARSQAQGPDLWPTSEIVLCICWLWTDVFVLLKLRRYVYAPPPLNLTRPEKIRSKFLHNMACRTAPDNAPVPER